MVSRTTGQPSRLHPLMGCSLGLNLVSLDKILGSIPGVWTPCLSLWGNDLGFGNVSPKPLYYKLGVHPLVVFRERGLVSGNWVTGGLSLGMLVSSPPSLFPSCQGASNTAPPHTANMMHCASTGPEWLGQRTVHRNS